jgi:hypothetical protein
LEWRTTGHKALTHPLHTYPPTHPHTTGTPPSCSPPLSSLAVCVCRQETPAWALYDSAEAGFNPTEERFTKAKKTREQAEEESKAREMALKG